VHKFVNWLTHRPLCLDQTIELTESTFYIRAVNDSLYLVQMRQEVPLEEPDRATEMHTKQRESRFRRFGSHFLQAFVAFLFRPADACLMSPAIGGRTDHPRLANCGWHGREFPLERDLFTTERRNLSRSCHRRGTFLRRRA
jgi:hypothetical protein